MVRRALDLERRSTADPRQLLESMTQDGMSPALAVNDLEQPAFDMCVSHTVFIMRLSHRAFAIAFPISDCLSGYG